MGNLSWKVIYVSTFEVNSMVMLEVANKRLMLQDLV